MFTDFVKRLKIDGCFHEYDYISLLKFEESRRAKFKIQVEEATFLILPCWNNIRS